jgi:uncharacterized membrane protein YphA (DoxX/SURF4 family)
METVRWRLGTKIAFRFAFVYFLLYTVDVPVQFLLVVPIEQVYAKYNALWQMAVPWVAQHVLHLKHDFTIFIINPVGGSQDTVFLYVRAFCYLLLAAAVTLVWSLLDRKRANYRRLHTWLMLYLRLVLAVTMITYGGVKVFPVQFPAPSLSRLLERYGDSLPMGLLWTFMGASPGYTYFAGAVELLGGILLLVPRLATLGALVAIGAIGNVLMLNLGYDVPVKLGSIHLLLMAGFIIAPDLRRLMDFFVLNRSVEAVSPRPLFRRKWLDVTAIALQIGFGLLFLGYRLHHSEQMATRAVESRKRVPLYGIWSVDEFKVDGKAEAPELTDQHPWQRLVVESSTDGMIEPVRGSDQYVFLHFDSQKKAFSMTKSGDPYWIAEFTYENPQPDLLVLTGNMGGHPISATLHKEDESKFLLKSRGFNWTQETALNR